MDDHTWIDLLDPDPAALGQALPAEVHETALERLHAPPRHDDEPRPRLETHGDYLFGVLVVPVFVAGDVRVVYQEVDIVATRQSVVAVRETPPGAAALSFEGARPGAGASGASPGMCLYHLCDEVAVH